MHELPSYTNEAREKRAAEGVDVEKNTMIRSAWDKATYQVVRAEDTHFVTDDGETILYTDFAETLRCNQAEILGTRATA